MVLHRFKVTTVPDGPTARPKGIANVPDGIRCRRRCRPLNQAKRRGQIRTLMCAELLKVRRDEIPFETGKGAVGSFDTHGFHRPEYRSVHGAASAVTTKGPSRESADAVRHLHELSELSDRLIVGHPDHKEMSDPFRDGPPLCCRIRSDAKNPESDRSGHEPGSYGSVDSPIGADVNGCHGHDTFWRAGWLGTEGFKEVTGFHGMYGVAWSPHIAAQTEYRPFGKGRFFKTHRI